MWVEVILSKGDLSGLFAQVMPLTVTFGEADHFLSLTDPQSATLVPDVGLRVACKAKLRWPVMGIGVPISLHSLVVLLRPTIAKEAGGDVLHLHVEIEHADFAGVPTAIDARLTERINKELATKARELSWNFTRALGQFVKLPSALDPVSGLALKVAWGKLKVNDEALTMVVSFHPTLQRHGADDGPMLRSPSLAKGGTEIQHESDSPTTLMGVPSSAIIAGGAIAAAVGVFLGASALRSRPKAPPMIRARPPSILGLAVAAGVGALLYGLATRTQD